MMESPHAARSPLAHRWTIPAIVAAVVCLLYAGTLVFGFVYDDNFQIVDNAWLTSARYIPRYFTLHVWAFAGVSGVYWRPVFLLWLFVQRAIFGVAPAGWHAANILMHGAATLLVFMLARRLTGDRATAAVVALIFGIHPALLESVAWVSGVSDPLLAVLLIPAFLFYLDWRELRSGRALALSAGFYALALMAKEPAIMLLPIIAAHALIYGPGGPPFRPVSGVPSARRFCARWGAWTEGRDVAHRMRDVFAAVLPYLPLTAAYLVFHAVVFGRANYVGSPATPWNNLLTIPALLAFYLKLLVWPAPISPEYDLRLVTRFSLPQVVLPSVIVAAAIALLWFWARRLGSQHDARKRLVYFAAVWMFLLLVPVLYIKPLDPFDFAHVRYLYLPCIGFALLVATAIRTIPADGWTIAGLPTRQFGAALIIVLALGAANLVQQVHWASNLLLFTRGVDIAPHNPTGLTNLGIEFGKREQYPKAIALMQRALHENPLDWHANFSLGYTYLILGRTSEAESLIEKAVRSHPADADPDQWAYLGMAALRLGDLTKAEWAVRNAVQRKPEVARYHHALALILEQEKRTAEAAAEFRETLNYDPGNADARSRLAKLQAQP
jgi:Flp pilus assembly protein TadD